MRLMTLNIFFKNQKIYSKADYFLFLILAFTIPFSQKLSTLILLLLFGVSLFNVKKFKINRNTVVLISLYLIYILFEIINQPVDYKIFEKKATFLALPIIFMLNNFTDNKLKKGLYFFVIGVFSASIVCYINAIYESLNITNGFGFNPYLSEENQGGFPQEKI